MKESDINRAIYLFDKNTEFVVTKYDISISREDLREIITPQANDSYIILQYDIDEAIAQKLGAYTDVVFDFEKYLYEIGTYAL